MAKRKIEDKPKKQLPEIGRKRAKSKIDQTEKWDITFNAISDLIFILNKDFKFVKMNKVFCDAVKAKPEDLIGKICYKVLHKSDKPWPNCPFVKVLKDKRPHAEEVCDPNIGIPLYITTSPLFDGKGEVAGVVHIAKDITERKKAEEVLKESERKFRTVIENINDVIFQLSPLGIIQFVSPKVEKYYGYKPEELIGKHLKKTTPMSEIPKALEMLKHVLSGKEIRNLEINQLDNKGKILVMEINAIPVKKESKIIAAQGVMRDITERKKAEEDLKSTYQITRDILETAPFGICLVSEKGMIEYVNPAMLKISGDTEEQFKKMNVFKLPSYKKIGIDDKIKSVLEGKPFFMGPVEYTSYYGKKTGIRNFIGIPFGKKEEREALIFVEDVTERVKAQGELKKTHDQLIQAEKLAAIGRLAAGVAHEINNPLFAISGEAQMLLKDKDKDKDTLDASKIILEQSERIKSIIDKLLEFSRKKEFKPESLDINEVLKKSVALLSYQKEAKKVKIIEELESHPPKIFGDSNKLQQAFLNIMLNAVQAMEEGGKLTLKTLSVKTQYEIEKYGRRATDIFKHGKKIMVIEFKDTGKGMNEETLKNLFIPFYSTREKGLGLGLPITYKIIEDHRGTIKTYSELGKGSTFIVKLPVLEKK